MTTFILLLITASIFYLLGRHDERKEVKRLKEFYQASIRELQSEIIAQKEMVK